MEVMANGCQRLMVVKDGGRRWPMIAESGGQWRLLDRVAGDGMCACVRVWVHGCVCSRVCACAWRVRVCNSIQSKSLYGETMHSFAHAIVSIIIDM